MDRGPRYLKPEAPADPRDIAATMRAVGPEHCFMDSDLGQLYSPLPVDGCAPMWPCC